MLPFLCAEVCCTTIHIQNKVPHRALGKMTPEEAFTGKRSDFSHFKIFGSLAYCHILGETCSILDQIFIPRVCEL